tara:strand:- start:191 stop:1162 length:972 start_codon:yes stop_codon:yes gene_type:complete
MISDNKSLESLYENELKPKLSELNKSRLYIISQIKRYAIYSTLPVAFSIYLSIYFKNPIPLALVLIISIGVSFFKVRPLWKTYYNQFKEQVIRQIIGFIDNSLSYNPSSRISQGEFEECGIYRTHIDRYRGDDYVEGMIDKTKVKFSEIHAEYKTQTTDSKGRTQTHWHTIFKGLLFSVDFNKDFNVKTYVLTDTAEKMFGFLGTKLQSMNKSRGELVKLENPEFEEAFAVYSSDQIEARYILSSSFMERILNFKKYTKKNIQLSFISSRMYIAVPYHKNLFEPKLFGDIVNFDHIKDYHNDLSLVLDLVNTLNLNTRIWTKK